MTIEEIIQSIFLRIFPELSAASFDFAKSQDQFERWDSFSHMELVAAIEKEGAVTLAMEEIVAVRTPQDFVDLVKKKKGAA